MAPSLVLNIQTKQPKEQKTETTPKTDPFFTTPPCDWGKIDVKDFVCIMGTTKFPALVDRCSGVLKAFQEADRQVSSNVTEHIIHQEKPRNGTQPTSPYALATTIREMKGVSGVVYLTAPTFTEIGEPLSSLLNNTRDFKFATFDFNSAMMGPLELGTLHYSISSLMYLQTLLPILLLYVQVSERSRDLVDLVLFASLFLTFPSLATNSSMSASESIKIISLRAPSW